MVGMYNWLCAMSILGCLFIAYIAFKISYKYIFSDQHEDGCIKYGCGVILVFIFIIPIRFILLVKRLIYRWL